MELTKELLEKLIAEGKGQEEIITATGSSMYKVKKAMEKYGLRTARMTGTGPISTQDLFKVHQLIREGAGDIGALIEKGIKDDVATAAVKKLKKDGLVKEALTAVAL
jgi:hypothetical protein